MHVKGFLHNLLGTVIHKSRIKVLCEVVEAAICTKKLKLTAIGRGINTGIQERSGIQKVNRLLGNQHLHEERSIIAKNIAVLLIGNKEHPRIIVDWTKYSNSEDAVLRAALSAEGRSITIYEERHRIKKMGNGKVQKNFLIALKKVLPKDCKAIIITDAGFHNDWFKEVLKLGWDYIGRLRGLKQLSPVEGNMFRPCKELFRLGTNKVKFLGEMIITKKNPMRGYVYIVKNKLAGRKALTKQGKVRKDKDSKAYSKAHREPWLLVSSLAGRNMEKKVQNAYACRMTIEEGIRDTKSSQYGFGLEDSKTVKKKRRDILLLIGMLASLIAWLTGKAGEAMNLHYQFQSNSIKHRRVISLVYLGCQLIRKNFHIPISLIRDAVDSLINIEAIYE